jgi:hypothetical protein
MDHARRPPITWIVLCRTFRKCVCAITFQDTLGFPGRSVYKQLIPCLSSFYMNIAINRLHGYLSLAVCKRAVERVFVADLIVQR